MYFPLITTFLLILVITIFALQNGMPLEVRFLSWGFKTSLIAVIFGAALIGALMVAVFALPIIIRKHFKGKKIAKSAAELEKRNQELEKQLTEKRPLRDTPSSPHLGAS